MTLEEPKSEEQHTLLESTVDGEESSFVNNNEEIIQISLDQNEPKDLPMVVKPTPLPKKEVHL